MGHLLDLTFDEDPDGPKGYGAPEGWRMKTAEEKAAEAARTKRYEERTKRYDEDVPNGTNPPIPPL